VFLALVGELGRRDEGCHDDFSVMSGLCPVAFYPTLILFYRAAPPEKRMPCNSSRRAWVTF
jgi:hypothetical protein